MARVAGKKRLPAIPWAPAVDAAPMRAAMARRLVATALDCRLRIPTSACARARRARNSPSAGQLVFVCDAERLRRRGWWVALGLGPVDGGGPSKRTVNSQVSSASPRPGPGRRRWHLGQQSRAARRWQQRRRSWPVPGRRDGGPSARRSRRRARRAPRRGDRLPRAEVWLGPRGSRPAPGAGAATPRTPRVKNRRSSWRAARGRRSPATSLGGGLYVVLVDSGSCAHAGHGRKARKTARARAAAERAMAAFYTGHQIGASPAIHMCHISGRHRRAEL